MIDAKRLTLIREKHGGQGSWAVWAPVPPLSHPAKSQVGVLDVLDERLNPALLEVLNPDVVMVGLNFGRRDPDRPAEPFRNFHSPSPWAHDFKIRYAFSGTSFWGAYMTDFIKGREEVVSKKLIEWLRRHPQVIADSLKSLRAELADLGRPRPIILAFGGDVHALLAHNLDAAEYSRLVRLPHYSDWVSKERYREDVHKQLDMLPDDCLTSRCN